ncbi:hypothetical protein [Streptomyces sp. MMS24-I29]|uniref:hypothetical protein n=1 Tax=Streptomyces sp. MMS24-I29 TaxID=3351480 RepID=UPI003C7DF285
MRAERSPEPRALLINGTVGVGKTSVAESVGDLLTHAGIPNAVRSRARLPLAAGTNVPLATGLGCLGMLAGPARTGRMARLMALDHAFPLPPRSA